jgi:hypothetical protein
MCLEFGVKGKWGFFKCTGTLPKKKEFFDGVSTIKKKGPASGSPPRLSTRPYKDVRAAEREAQWAARAHKNAQALPNRFNFSEKNPPTKSVGKGWRGNSRAPRAAQPSVEGLGRGYKVVAGVGTMRFNDPSAGSPRFVRCAGLVQWFCLVQGFSTEGHHANDGQHWNRRRGLAAEST